MELHSYAKRKATKKWTIEQKRKLVETRIKYDSVFGSKPTNSVIPWKRILSIAKLDDFNIFFVRKQWSNMVSKYKQYKEKCIDNKPTTSIDEEMILKITNEWEFFQPIHRFMARKTTNLHSYAADPEEEHQIDVAKRKQHQQHEYQRQQLERGNMFSSDTNEEYATVSHGDNSNSNSNAANEFAQTQNTDHDSYTKKSAQLHQQLQQQHQLQQTVHYFADISEDTQESIIQVELTTTEVLAAPPPVATVTVLNGQEGGTGKVAAQINRMSTTKYEQKQCYEGQPIYTEQNGHHSSYSTAAAGTSKPRLSERDKYYRHKRRYHHRLERRFDGLLNVFGQVIKAEYPNMDVSLIMGSGSETAAAAAVTAGVSLANTLFSSSEDDDDDDDDDDSVADSTHTTDDEKDVAMCNVYDEQVVQHQMPLDQQQHNDEE